MFGDGVTEGGYIDTEKRKGTFSNAGILLGVLLPVHSCRPCNDTRYDGIKTRLSQGNGRRSAAPQFCTLVVNVTVT